MPAGIMSNYMQGLFKPKHPERYRGDVKNITYRSSWELAYFSQLDRNPDVVWWSSEETIVPYSHPVTGKFARYFPDIIQCTRDPITLKETITMVEIKPAAQCVPPKVVPKKRKTKRQITEICTFATNQAKWAAAERYCQTKGWDFRVLTERELGLGKL